MRLLVTRPAPDANAQAEKLRALGHDPIVSPLLKVEYLRPELPDFSSVQALIVTSHNALRAFEAHGIPGAALKLPLFAVGRASANRARGQGFGDVRQGPGTAEGLLPLIQAQCDRGDRARGFLLHLAGEQTAFDLKGALESRGFEAAQLALYRMSAPECLSMEACDALASGTLDGVILMSPATARAYVALVAAPGLAKAAAKPAYYCLSKNVAAPLTALAGANIFVSPSPSEDDLLALAGCKTAKC